MDLVEKVLPEPTDAQWLAGLRDAQTYLHSLGITMLQDANVNVPMLEIYKKAASTGQLTMKVVPRKSPIPAPPPPRPTSWRSGATATPLAGSPRRR